MYGLMLAVASKGEAIGATVLNRLAITVVEVLLLGEGRSRSNIRFPNTCVGGRLRHLSHDTGVEDGWQVLRVAQRDELTEI